MCTYKCACDQTTTHTVNDSILLNLLSILNTNVPLLSELFMYTMCMLVYTIICTLICLYIFVFICVVSSICITCIWVVSDLSRVPRVPSARRRVDKWDTVQIDVIQMACIPFLIGKRIFI